MDRIKKEHVVECQYIHVWCVRRKKRHWIHNMKTMKKLITILGVGNLKNSMFLELNWLESILSIEAHQILTVSLECMEVDHSWTPKTHESHEQCSSWKMLKISKIVQEHGTMKTTCGVRLHIKIWCATPTKAVRILSQNWCKKSAYKTQRTHCSGAKTI